jgi:GDP-L-fucose synthase
MADAALFLMNNYNSGEIINVGSGNEISIKHLAFIIKDIVDYKGLVEFNSSYPDGTPRKFLDSSRLRELGWKPKILLYDGIETNL